MTDSPFLSLSLLLFLSRALIEPTHSLSHSLTHEYSRRELAAADCHTAHSPVAPYADSRRTVPESSYTSINDLKMYIVVGLK